MQSAYKVAAEAKAKGITNINIEVRAPGGHGSKDAGTRGAGSGQGSCKERAQGMKIGDVTPIPTDTTRRPGGRRGRRV